MKLPPQHSNERISMRDWHWDSSGTRDLRQVMCQQHGLTGNQKGSGTWSHKHLMLRKDTFAGLWEVSDDEHASPIIHDGLRDLDTPGDDSDDCHHPGRNINMFVRDRQPHRNKK